MNREKVIEYCLGKPFATKDFPFDENSLVTRVGGKIFALFDLAAEEQSVNLKCDPELSFDLRAAWPAIRPGYHMNKEHWNTLILDGSLPDELITSLVDRSWDLVSTGLTRAEREKAGMPPKPRAE